MNFKDKVLLYLYRKSDIIDNEYDEHIHFTRYHKADEVDHLESIIRKVRRDTFRELEKDIYALLTLSEKNELIDRGKNTK